jgi:hypothetical protein
MRQKLNENPVAQIAVIAVLAVIVGYFVLSHLGGGSESESAAPAAESSETEAGATEEVAGALEGSSPAAATSAVSAPTDEPLPKDIEAAYKRGETIVLLVYRPGGIDDSLTGAATSAVDGMSNVTFFEVKVGDIAKYSAITGPLGVNQAPALIVIRSSKLNGGGAAPATVTYGFQTASDVTQAVVDSGYKGPELTYAPN